jgi:transcriptional regulator with XRE-family HTH domain
MNFQELHELLRLELTRRIERGALTQSRLAQQAGFQQAHISNFLNSKRALSLEGLDRVLASQNLTIDQILPIDLNAAAQPAPVQTPSSDPVEVVPVVSPSTAMDDPRINPSAIIETIQVSASRLHDNRARPSTRHAHWQRFLAIRADTQQAAAMEPLLTPGAIAVLDRHYTSLAPYRAHQPTLYAVRCGAALLIRFVDFDEGRLILRPYSRDFPIQLLPLATHESPADYLVGRVCLIFSEL